MSTPIAASDLTWLHMDQPNNLMHIHGLLTFDELPEWQPLADAIFDRIISKYRVLSQIPVNDAGHWVWRDDPEFSLDRHLRRVILGDDDPETMRAFLSQQFSRPFDRALPLWEMQLVSGPHGPGGALLTRFHHGLGDGIRMVQLLLGMCDPTENGSSGKVGRGQAAHRSALGAAAHFIDRSVRDSIDYVQHASAGLAELATHARPTLNPLDLPHTFESAIELLRHPTTLIDAVTSVSSVDNAWSNSWRELGRVVLAEPAVTDAWSGHPGVDKSVSWLEGLDLDRVKKAGKKVGGTVNDILLAAISLALTDYLTLRGVEAVEDIAWLMPVSLQPFDGQLPAELGNHFSVVLLPMPLGITDGRELVSEVRHRTSRIKHSAEPAITFGVQRVIAEAPAAIATRLTEFFSAKAIGQLTNVPGPAQPIALAGAPIRSVLGWVPTAGDQPIGVCLFTYAGTVSVGVATDARMIPDPVQITDLIRSRLHGLEDEILGPAEDEKEQQ